ncbi:hypothetical protein D3C87_2130780 [compost metagenome]
MFQAGRPISGSDSRQPSVASMNRRRPRSRRGKCCRVCRKWRLNWLALRQWRNIRR